MTKRRSECLQDAIGDIDEAFVEEAINATAIPKKRSAGHFAWITAAAAAAAVALAFIFLPGSFNNVILPLFIAQSDVSPESVPNETIPDEKEPDIVISSEYLAIIDMTREIVDAIDSGDEPRNDIESAEERYIYGELWKAVDSRYPHYLREANDARSLFAKFMFSYAIGDYDGDGTEEMILADSYRAIALFTLRDGSAALMGSLNEDKSFGTDEQGNILMWENGACREYMMSESAPTYLPLYGERQSAVNMLKKALYNEVVVYHTGHDEYRYLKDNVYPHTNKPIAYYRHLIECTLVDMDGDRIEELILDVGDRNFILRFCEGEVYFDTYWNEIVTVHTDGSYFFYGEGENGNYCYGVARMYFNGRKRTEAIEHVTYNGKDYYIGGNSVNADELYDYYVAHPHTDMELVWLDWGNEGWFFKVETAERAESYAEIYFGRKDGDIDEETGGVYEITVEDDPYDSGSFIISSILYDGEGHEIWRSMYTTIDKQTGSISKG